MTDFATMDDFAKALFLSSIIAYAVGFVGNLLVIALLCRKYSYSLYTQVKAGFDLIVILGIMLVMMKSTLGMSLAEMNAFFCHMSYFGRYVGL